MTPGGNFVCYIMYLTAIRQHMKREKLGDEHHAWYKVPELDDTPMEMRLTRKMYSSVWKKQINHTRCTDPDVVAQYDRRIKTDCTIENKYRNLEYTFTINLYAVTATHLYIQTDKEGDVCTLVMGNNRKSQPNHLMADFFIGSYRDR